ncbi:MAG: L-seryl-tRNA(Sec) selenium transferase [Polyangia bacterium]
MLPPAPADGSRAPSDASPVSEATPEAVSESPRSDERREEPSPELRQRLRRLPKVDEELRRIERALDDAAREARAGDDAARESAAPPRWALTQAVRDAITARRRRILEHQEAEAGETGETGASLDTCAVLAAARRLVQPPLRPVLNATGVVLHTNLGRAPLPARALRRITETAAGYCNLEYQLEQGRRGSRQDLLPELLRPLTGAEAHLVVNNNAAAVLLMLAGLCAGQTVVVSRGELVEIGGSFRVPDVMRASGAILCEVGTTNRTHRRDYEAAAEGARAFLKVHRGNFALVGFVAEVGIAELARLAHERGLLCLYDVGSGALAPAPVAVSAPRDGESLDEGSARTAAAEPTVPQAVAAGCDVVTFSCDKLLGGPQAGVLCGSAAAVRPLHKHPLLRALRPDKLSLAALLATLELYRDGKHDEIPTLRMLAEPAPSLRARAERLLAGVRALGLRAEVVEVRSAVGGGALPLCQPQSYAVAVADGADGADRGPGRTRIRDLEAALRRGEPAVVARIDSGRLLFDVRTLPERDLPLLLQALAAACA